MHRRERIGRDDGVSPVVGMILVLGISIVGIAAVLYWGLPAIDEMKANVEHRSVESQFLELDATIDELVAGTTEKTAKRWQPSLNRGQIVLVNETEGWVYSVIRYDGPNNYVGDPADASPDGHSFVYAGFDDGDHSFTIYNKNKTVASATIFARRVNSTTSGEDLIVSTTAPGTQMAAIAPWTAGAGSRKTFTLWDERGLEVPIGNATIHFTLYDGATKIAEAWYVPTGRIDYRLESGVQPKTVSQNNGAVLTGNGESYAILNPPPIPAAANTTGVTRHFARAVVLNGTTSFAGADRFDVLVTLYSTFTLSSGYDCARTAQGDYTDCAEAVQVFAFGSFADTWYDYFLAPGRGYSFKAHDVDGVEYLDDREGYMGFTLLQSTIHMAVS